MLSEAPPASDAATTSWVCRLFTEVNALTSSGISAPARVPHDTISASFHQVWPSPSPGTSSQVVANVRPMETREVTHTSSVSGASKSRSGSSACRDRVQARVRPYDAAEASTITARITKIHTSSVACRSARATGTASMMNVTSATPVTP